MMLVKKIFKYAKWKCIKMIYLLISLSFIANTVHSQINKNMEELIVEKFVSLPSGVYLDSNSSKGNYNYLIVNQDSISNYIHSKSKLRTDVNYICSTIPNKFKEGSFVLDFDNYFVSDFPYNFKTRRFEASRNLLNSELDGINNHYMNPEIINVHLKIISTKYYYDNRSDTLDFIKIE